jgi:hypothetical protein
MPKFNDLTGQTFFNLTAIRRADVLGTKIKWLWRCSCGTEIIIEGFRVSSGRQRSCGCKNPQRKIDMAGKRFNLWTVLEATKKTGNWKCQCDCGEVCIVSGQNLRSGKSMGCGCTRKTKGEDNFQRRQARQKHGGNYIPRDSEWYNHAGGILARCRQTGIKNGFSSIHDLASYLKLIAPDVCPVFGVPFNRGKRGFSAWSPSVDRRDTTKGYVRGNLQIMSMKANGMKNNATAIELRQFAEWVLHTEAPKAANQFEAGASAGLLH